MDCHLMRVDAAPDASKNPQLPPDLIEWFEGGTDAGVRTISFQTNLARLPAPVQNELQAILDCARLAVTATQAAARFSGRFEDASLHIDPAQNRRLPLIELKAEAQRWILKAAFRDAMELVLYVLDQARNVLCLWSLLGTIKGEDYLARYEREGVAFHRKGLSEKLEFLRKKYAFEVHSDAVDVVQSLNRARNCVVHRLGWVSELDVGPDGTLKAVWEEYAIMAGQMEEPGQAESSRRIGRGDVIHGGEMMWIRRVKKVREYPLGARVSLSVNDITEICHTIHLFANQVRDDLKRKRKELGLA